MGPKAVTPAVLLGDLDPSMPALPSTQRGQNRSGLGPWSRPNAVIEDFEWQCHGPGALPDDLTSVLRCVLCC